MLAHGFKWVVVLLDAPGMGVLRALQQTALVPYLIISSIPTYSAPLSYGCIIASLPHPQYECGS